MGGWQLEVFKMALYMSFPVGLFHWFNQPEYFEKWVNNEIRKIMHFYENVKNFQVIEKKRELYPPDNKGHREQIEECIRQVRAKQDVLLKEQLAQMESEEKH